MTHTLFMLIAFMLMFLSLVSANNGSQSYTSNHTASLYLPLSSCTMYFDAVQSTPLIFYNCQSSSHNSSSWQQCFSLCCGELDYQHYQTPSSDAVSMCRNINQKGESSSLYILKIALIVGFVVLAIAIFIIIAICRKRCTMNNTSVHSMIQSLRLKQVKKKRRKVEWEEQKQINFEDSEVIVWSSNASVGQILEAVQQPCTICLEQKTTTQLYCGHQYHPRCIGEWLTKSPICASCRHTTRGAKIYCSICKWRYYVVTRDFLQKNRKTLSLTCPTCEPLRYDFQSSNNHLKNVISCNGNTKQQEHVIVEQ